MAPLFLVLYFLAISGCNNNQVADLNMKNSAQNQHLTDDRLALCPDRPNCVSSEIPDAKFYIAPITFSGSSSETWQALLDVLVAMGGTIETDDGTFCHATYRSTFFRFVDDLTCRLDEEKKLIHFRSASRVGYTDFGVNRKRVEKIHQLLNANKKGQYSIK